MYRKQPHITVPSPSPCHTQQLALASETTALVGLAEQRGGSAAGAGTADGRAAGGVLRGRALGGVHRAAGAVEASGAQTCLEKMARKHGHFLLLTT